MHPSYSDPRADRIQRFSFSNSVAKKILAQERCFILGLGPSLAKIEPKGLSDEVVIGTNHILRTELKPDMICVVDERRFDVNAWSKTDIKVITVRPLADRRKHELASINCYQDIGYADYDNGLKKNITHIDGFDNRLEEVHFSGSVITDLAVPLACYLGFKEIYVLGLDGAVASFPSTHVTGNEDNYQITHSSKLFSMHQKVATIAAQKGVTVANASPGGVVTALEKISLESVKPNALRKQFKEQVDGRFIVFGDRIMRLSEKNGIVRIIDEASNEFARHKFGRVSLEKDDGSDLFTADSSYRVEPSFVNKDWVSFASTNIKNVYISALDELSGYRISRLDEIFSPYFSSFRLYETRQRARQRAINFRQLQTLSSLRNSVGDSMLADDYAS